MKTNGKIQLYPMVRMSVLLILGMVMAYYTSSHIPSWLWLGGALVILLMTTLVRQELRQSAVVMLLVFLLGGCLMSRSLLLASSPTDTIETSPSMTQRAQANALELRNQLVNTLSDKDLGQQELAVVSAMTLGDKSLIDKDLKNDYSRSGASHVLALSGLHLGIIYFVFSFMTARWRRRYHHWSRPVSEGLILITMWSYVVLVGMSPSVVRAAIMMTVYSLLSLQNRNRSSLNALAFTAIIMLVADPMILFNISFQLSFVAVAFILLYQGRIYSLIPSSTHPIVKWCWRFLSVSLAAQLGVAPLTAYYFHQIPSYFLLSSLVVMVFTPLIIYLSLLFFLLMWLPVVQSWLVVPLSWLVHIQNTCLQGVSSLSGSTIVTPSLHPLQVCLIYIIIFAVDAMIYRFRLYKRNIISNFAS
jgi:competence protein ComEC